jgi:hypothetical protein
LIDRNITIPDLISIRFNLTDLRFEGFSIDPTVDLVTLVGNDEATISFRDFRGKILANYMYITDPPLLADIGQIHFENYNTSLYMNGFSKFDDGMLNITLAAFDLEVDPFVLHFDGISDTSDVISRFLTFAGNVIGDRISSLSRFPPALTKFNNLINTIISIIPDELDIPGTDLYF